MARLTRFSLFFLVASAGFAQLGPINGGSASPSGAAGGNLSGTYPNPSVIGISKTGSVSNVGATNETVLLQNSVASGITAVQVKAGASQAFNPYFSVYDVSGNLRMQCFTQTVLKCLFGAAGSTGTELEADIGPNVSTASGYNFSTSADPNGTVGASLKLPITGMVEVDTGVAGTLVDFKRRFDAYVVTTVASGTTIALTSGLTHITGTTPIVTITAPTNLALSSGGGCVLLIPDGLWTTTTGGNIALASTAVVSKLLELCYDNATSKWYPSY